MLKQSPHKAANVKQKTIPKNMLNIKLKLKGTEAIKIFTNSNSSILKEWATQNYLGLEIFAASAGGAYLVIAQRISAAFAWTSGESWYRSQIIKKSYGA
jgi:hypothetical protein